MTSRTERREKVTRGTGNVFADLGFSDAAEREARLRLAYALNQVLNGRKLSQAEAAKVLGVTQPKVSAPPSLQAGGLFCRPPDESIDGARPGRRDRDSAKTSLAESCQNHRRRSTRLADGTDTKGHSPTAQIVHEREAPRARSTPQRA
jgi:predicted XRE-type DNA-binding protein